MKKNIKTEEEITKNWKSTHPPLVSIICITFNHDKFFKESIESLLAQETDFAFEILIHDDASTDKTTDLISFYSKKYPKIIRTIVQKVNQYSQNIEILSEFALPASQGKYIALCEGDDYWTDAKKLQVQVDFLEKNNSYSAVTHQARKIFENEIGKSELFHSNVPETLYLNDLLDGRLFHTASLLFRAEITKKHNLPSNIVSVDRALNFLVAAHGPIKYFETAMCVYRKNAGGVSSRVTPAMLKKDFKIIPWISDIYINFPKYRYRSFIHKTIFSYPPKINIKEIIINYFLYAAYSFSFFPKNIKPLAVATLKTLPLKIFTQLKNK